MRHLIIGLALAAALSAAFLLGRCTAQPAVDMEQVVSGPIAAPEPSAVGNAARPAPGRRSPATAPAKPAGSASPPGGSPRGGTSTTPVMPAPPAGPSTGPQPLLQDDAPMLERAEAHHRAESGTWRDLLDLAASEAQDAEGRRLEQRLTQAILRHGGRHTLLRLAPPHCTRSVCVMRGVGVGQSNDPRSDWQRLSSVITNEPWFRESFDDVLSSVNMDGGETVYMTLYVRCDPGTCRFSGR